VAAPIRRLSGVSPRPSSGRRHRRGWLRSPLGRPRGHHRVGVVMWYYGTIELKGWSWRGEPPQRASRISTTTEVSSGY